MFIHYIYELIQSKINIAED